MRAADVASMLNFNSEDFQRMESSLATIFNLEKDEAGYVYDESHLETLKKVFSSQNQGSLVQGADVESFSFEQLGGETPEQYKETARVLGSPKQNDEWNTEQISESFLNEAAKAYVDYDQRFEDEMVKKPAFEKIVTGKTPASSIQLEDISKLLNDQRQFFEQSMLSEMRQQIESLKQQNYQLKKEVKSTNNKLLTLKNIINNLNDDKRVLIAKLNEKFSFKSLLGWRTEKDSFGANFSEL